MPAPACTVLVLSDQGDRRSRPSRNKGIRLSGSSWPAMAAYYRAGGSDDRSADLDALFAPGTVEGDIVLDARAGDPDAMAALNGLLS